jgi:four helix bundle protein
LRKGKDIEDRTFRFACDVVDVCDAVAHRGFSARIVARQLVGSGTSIGSNLEEADGAQSRADFVSKCNIALKEARESHDWLRILRRSKKIDDERLLTECDEIIAILTTIVRKTRGD